MPTGPEHYTQSEAYGREAEAQLAEGNLDAARIYAELATGSATRALAAAVALSDPTRSAPRATVPEWDSWTDVAGVGAEDYEDRGSMEDVYSASELAEYDRDTEYRLDAEDDARNTAEYEAEQRDGA